MTYEECQALVDSYASAVLLSKSADLREAGLAEAEIIRDSLGEFISSVLYCHLKDKERE